MEVIISQPVFLWIFGIIGVLIVLWLLVMLTIFVQLARLLKLANEKAADIATTIDEVRATIHRATETVDDTKEKIANFITFTTSAAGIAKMVGSIRDQWTTRHAAVETDDLFGDKHTKRSQSQR